MPLGTTPSFSQHLHASLRLTLIVLLAITEFMGSKQSLFKGVMRTKYKPVSLEKLLCPDNSDANFIANFEQIV